MSKSRVTQASCAVFYLDTKVRGAVFYSDTRASCAVFYLDTKVLGAVFYSDTRESCAVFYLDTKVFYSVLRENVLCFIICDTLCIFTPIGKRSLIFLLVFNSHFFDIDHWISLYKCGNTQGV